ncbi:MAG: MIP family channel protein [Chloroflexi bacterium]|nr:MIP family channel protein [Chloroflexota bacterium]
MNWRGTLAEGIGTFAFFFIGAGAICTNAMTGGQVGPVGIALAHGLALAIMISAFGAVSGGHFNPAVSIAMAVVGRLSAAQTVLYVIAQLIGAVIAGFVLRLVFAEAFPAAVSGAPHLGTPGLAPAVSFGSGILIEAILTFFLLLAIFGTAVDPRAPRIGGFGIGLTVAFDILMGGPLTGAAMNPARTFGPALASGFFDNHLVYWVGPIVGAIVAAVIYETFIMEKKREA